MARAKPFRTGQTTPQRSRSVDLQRVTHGDKAELIAANLANRPYHEPWARPFTDDAGFHAWFARCVTGPNVSLLAREPRSGELIGVVNLNEIVMGAFRSCFVGYYGYERWSGQGYMTAALRAAATFAFRDLGLHRLEANIQPENLASIRLAQRAGFQKEGFSPRYLFLDGAWRDHEHWVLLNPELPHSSQLQA
ncbi:GNAT family N-acetyltransferase [Silvibacterium dinghuense]|uniref:GNAT family N-acetyltransferase n=1 Tax=Silvibacterium dinghuense TaxID=1560006 RepID=A0A4Q1SKM0_9BACT|nr:GNAT family N-acetyltransferase [Silvibacterium dinghuense]RXS97850.1 GNAT family N-acetyltransferase [Silvibacterium dinghuense]GGH02491.1 hypothetical protein GCM10011586_17860 [Silvibacterium dinghuense]